jgi:hypothetical protein
MPCFIDGRTWRASERGLLKVGIFLWNVANGQMGYSYRSKRLAFDRDWTSDIYGEAKSMMPVLHFAL